MPQHERIGEISPKPSHLVRIRRYYFPTKLQETNNMPIYEMVLELSILPDHKKILRIFSISENTLWGTWVAIRTCIGRLEIKNCFTMINLPVKDRRFDFQPAILDVKASRMELK